MAAAMLLTGCATVIDKATQSVLIDTAPEDGAQCTLANSEGVWRVVSPGLAKIRKTQNDLSVDCIKPGVGSGHVVAASHFRGTTAGNVIFGGIVGVGIDAASGGLPV